MQQYELIALKSYIAVVETGSFSRAADQLQASTAAVSRRVSGLEKSLGVKLLNRTTRSIDLTEAGQQFYNDVVHILQALEEAEERICSNQQAIRGSLRVAVPLSYGIQKISPLLPLFMKRYPELNIQLQLDDRYNDLISEGIDVAIRIGTLKDSSMVATRVGSIERVFCASQEYLDQHGTPESPEDLKEHNCLQYNLLNSKEEWNLTEDGHSKNIGVTGSLSTNNGEVLKQAVIQGVGIALLPRFIAQAEIDSGDLTIILKAYQPEAYGLYAIRPSRSYTPARVKLFIEFVKSFYHQ